MKKILFEDLSVEFFYSLEYDETFQIIYNELNFYFKSFLKEDNDNLIFFSNGAVDRKKKTPPVFMRSSWSEDIKANCIFIDDRTIHDTILRIGWGVGVKSRHYLNDYSMIAKKITTILNIKEQNVFYCGSSAGGFMSMLLASMHKDTTAIVNNPQTAVLEFNKSHVKELCETIFPNMSKEEILIEYAARLNVVDAFDQSDYLPSLYYLQNRKCDRDMETQYKPFIQGLKRKNVSESKFTYILYNDYEKGHEPLLKNDFIKEVHKIILNC
ncbi:hypothetical protein [Aliicoccus persicus]|uniref:Prolyl oligopeptidase family protein n=1 Tax=Aliicoccus persicus TaxID=930138 RepID=A0A662Z1T6_9STAP|nr:hypothetical protein [Aliicoccus persicus]SEV79698.1 hypothetical protein SAMN05192557_0015 [Aliicoccus persicus]